MALSAGTRLGPYEILASIGAGGMGEVYRARDTRLDRSVAIKILPAHVAHTPEARQRFEREARAVSVLNHPHICTLHDIGSENGVDYMVMECVEGETLAERIKKGPLPLDQALTFAIQISDALDKAHRRGVVHRDLKPGNIMLGPTGVKILDFGLAKIGQRQGAAVASGGSLLETLTTPITGEGSILGTPQYMAPEQYEGKEADARSDIFAFGLVLYEMITGNPAFEGKTQANLIAAIMAGEPRPVTSFQPLIPPALVHLIGTCLAKDPDARRQTMHDVLLELRWIAEGGSQAGIPKPVVAHSKRWERLAWVAAAAASVAVVALSFVHFRETPAPVYPIRFEQPVPPKNHFRWWDVPAVSPDGRAFAYTGARSGANPVLWVRHLDAIQSTPLSGTEGAALPFWSPDGRFIGYYTEGKLWKIDVNGGPSQILCDLPGLILGASWNRDGSIIFGPPNGPIHQVPSTGGNPKPLLKLDGARKEIHQGWPHFLPDGRHFLYASFSSEAGMGGTYLGSIDGQEPRRVLDAISNVSVVLPDLLLFVRGRVLMAQKFDLEKLRASGESFPVADLVGRRETTQNSVYSSSPNGVLVYRSQISLSAESQLAWYDRNGRRLGTIGEPRIYRQGVLSPDEKRFAVQVLDPKGENQDIWLLDLASGILSRTTSDRANKDTVVWSPDGREILFSSNKAGRLNLYRKIIGGGDEQLVQAATDRIYPAEWLKDGTIIFMNENGRSFFRLPAGAGAQAETLLKTEYSKDEPRVSPDGRWVSYNTNESGRWEVYIASFPGFTDRRQVSNNGGAQGYWRKDGKELFYLSLDGDMVSVPIKPGPALEAGMPKVLFPTRISFAPAFDQFAVTRDGARFLLLESIEETDAKPFTIELNWPAALRR